MATVYFQASAPRGKVPVKTKGPFDRHRTTDVMQSTTSWPDKESVELKGAKADGIFVN